MIRYSRLAAAVLAPLFAVAAPLAAAHLRVIDSVTDQQTAGTGATLEIHSLEPGTRAPEDYGYGVGTGAGMTLGPNDQPSCNFALASLASTFAVEPDEGEFSGGCVRISFCHSGSFTVTRSGSNMGAAAGVGGGGFAGNCSLGPPPLGTISFPGPGRLILDPSGAADVLSTFGPQVIVADSPDQSFENCGEISVRIGDELRVEIAAGSSSYGTPTGSAQAGSSQEIRIVTRACPIQEIPTISAYGGALLALALVALAIVALRRRAARPAL